MLTGFKLFGRSGTSGSNDTAYLYDAPGVNIFEGQGSYGYIYANGIVYGMEGFGKVYLIATASNQDWLEIGSLDYVLTESGTWILA